VRIDVRKYWNNYHAEGLAPDVWDRIQRYLPAVKCGRVAAQLRRQSVRSFMARRREEKDDVPNYAVI